MFRVELLIIGKLKDKHLKEVEYDYYKRINDFEVNIHELKDTQVLEKLTSLEKEAKRTLPFYILAEWGDEFTSRDFSKMLYDRFEISPTIVLAIGGDEGHRDKVIERSNGKISLSKMTFPHQMARVMLVEQLYRAQAIKNKHPYAK
jgi:23S rRNA (pseudouridine1915-N3)-methyltransferase